MEWLWGLPLLALLMCGAMCIGGAAVALVVGKRAVDQRHDSADAARREQRADASNDAN